MSAAPTPKSVEPSSRGIVVTVHRRDGVEVAGEEHPLAAPELGAGHDVVPEPLDVEPRAELERRLHGVGHDLLAVADGRDAHERRGQAEQPVRYRIGHIDTPWVRRMSLSCALSWRCPSVRRRSTSTHGR